MARGRVQLTTALALAAAMLTALAMVGTTAFGKNGKPSAAQYQYKVTICHRTKSKKKPFVTISVAGRALPAHLRHGDTLGPCSAAPASSTGSTTQKGKGKSKDTSGTTQDQKQGQEQAQGQGNGSGNGKGKGKGKSK